MLSPHPLRTWLILGRVSNLPTVWSNCFAGWLLGRGSTEWGRLALVCLGGTFLYVGGMYLNDAFDAHFDAQHRRERPIPSGIISAAAVWRAGFALLALGILAVLPLGKVATLNALLLAGSIIVYDAVHKLVTFSPILMAFCRFFLYLTAAAAAAGAVTGAAIWSAFALAAYIAGLSWVARKESTGVSVRLWPLSLLLVPIVLALLINDTSSWRHALFISAVLVLWSARCLRSAFTEPRNVGRAVSGLLAGIVWVDLLAVVDQPRERGAVFIALFLLALLFQRFVPAT